MTFRLHKYSMMIKPNKLMSSSEGTTATEAKACGGILHFPHERSADEVMDKRGSCP